MRSFGLHPWISLIAFLGVSAPISAQSQPDWPARQFIGEKMIVDVDVVEVFFTVERDHQFVKGLRKEDFVVLENDRRQQIRYFSAESQAQLSLGVLIDTSTSEFPMLQREHEIARRFFNTVLVKGDEALVATFDSHIQLRQDFTRDHELLVNSIERCDEQSCARSKEIDRGPSRRARSTALYDAIFGFAKHRFAERRGRKAMIVITDGQDVDSRAKPDQAIEAALKSNVICYVLLVGDPAYMSRHYYVGKDKMKYLAAETGGRVINLDRRSGNMEGALLQIADELRHHYSIGYSPGDRGPSEAYRKISVQAQGGYQVKARHGYYYTPPREVVQSAPE